MTLEELTTLAEAAVHGNAITERFKDRWKGDPVVICGNGPSAKQMQGQDILAHHLVCNGAIELFPDADVWLTAESSIHKLLPDGTPEFPWFYGGESFEGDVIMEHCCVYGGVERDAIDPSRYSDDFWRRVTWICRNAWHEDIDNDLSQTGHDKGLYYGMYKAPDGETRNAGSCVMQALHLCKIAGAAEVHLYGTELCWPYAGKQHAAGEDCYTEELAERAQELALTRFDWSTRSDSERIELNPEGNMQTMGCFLDSAPVLQRFIKELGRQGMKVVNHSGGLLDLRW